jgi:hypothetical protein
MNNRLTVTGEINTKGEYGLYNIAQLNDFCKNNAGKKLIITFQAEDKKSKNGLIAYYNAKLIPLWQDIFYKIGDIKNEVEIDVYLRSQCPITRIKSLSELEYDELLMFMDSIKNHTLVEGNQFIEEPRCL